MKIAPYDIKGKDLKVGDWVRVLAVPISIQNMPGDTKKAFSRAVGETLQIESFNEIGCLELYFWPKLGLDTIWLEPYCVKRFRRYKKFSKRFKKILELNKELERPRLIFKFKAIWPKGGNHSEGIDKLSYDEMDIGYGWSVWPDERRMEGDFSILQHKKHSMEKLEKCREHIRSISYFDVIEVSAIELEKSNLYMAFGCQGKNHPIDRKMSLNEKIFRLNFRFLDKRLVRSGFCLPPPASERIRYASAPNIYQD